MATFIFRLPDVGEGVAEAEIVAWHVKPGDRVSEDQSLVDVMTDKATVDMTSPVDGVVRAIHGEIGASVAVGSPLVELEIAGEADAPAGQAPEAEAEAETPAEPIPATPPSLPAAEPRATAGAHNPPLASPSTRRRAKERGIPLDQVRGSGPNGRILVEDLDSFVAQRSLPSPAAAKARDAITETRIIGLRRKIAEKMQDAKRRIPHIAYVEECDLTELEALRGTLNEHRLDDQPKLTLLPFLIRAMVRVLPEFPQINARYDDEGGLLRAYEAVHVGIATQTPGGLMVPVIRNADQLDVWQIAREITRLSKAARDGSAAREELSGSTITITSLGPLGGVVTTPVINHPEVAIIGPNKLIERPIVSGSFVTVRKMMNISSSFDHRIVDGYDAASFIQRLKRLLEHPALIFMS
ncbi:MAG: dihydrolipoamide acetyltransferase family protein [Sphingobium sp.]|nr:dihydrolipoamide acetyltransferase family protein [Sphingobium sp.]